MKTYKGSDHTVFTRKLHFKLAEERRIGRKDDFILGSMGLVYRLEHDTDVIYEIMKPV